MAAETTAATETQAEHKAGFPPFEPEYFPSQLLWLAITFGAIYIFISRVAVKRIGGLIAERADRISRDLEEASAAKTRSDEMAANYAQSLALARDKAQGLAREMRDRTTAASESKRKETEAALALKLATADKEIAARKAQAMANVGAIAQEAAAAIVARITGQAANASELEAGLTATSKR
jgi:F-type H+-transporting ATPase subunit b